MELWKLEIQQGTNGHYHKIFLSACYPGHHVTSIGRSDEQQTLCRSHLVSNCRIGGFGLCLWIHWDNRPLKTGCVILSFIVVLAISCYRVIKRALSLDGEDCELLTLLWVHLREPSTATNDGFMISPIRLGDGSFRVNHNIDLRSVSVGRYKIHIQSIYFQQHF